MNSSKEKDMTAQTADHDLARLLREADLFAEQNVKDLRLEHPTYKPLRLEFTRKSKKTSADGGNTSNTRRKRRKRGKSNGNNSQEDNKENVATPKKLAESFLREWHDDEVDIADYRSSDDSQDEQLQEWYKDLKSNKTKDINIPPVKSNAKNVGPVIRHESSDEEKSWLHTDIAETYLLDMMAKYPAAANPYEIIFDDLMEPRRWIEKTHQIAENVMLMKKNRIFTILRQNRPRNLLAHLRLGYCITQNPGRPECQQEGRTCALQCHVCGVCCHMYSCTCRLVKRFQWCSHIHAAVSCGDNRFKNDQQVYLHISSRYTQLSHLRATCFDMAVDVKPVENNENAFIVMGWITEYTPFSVFRSSKSDVCHVCPQYKRCPECSTCRHQYLCACAEYMVQKRLCEHCHVVAIFLSDNRAKTLKKREFHYLSDVSDDTDEEADPERDASPIMLPLRIISAHHEKSFSIPFRRIQVGSVNDQLVYFIRRCDPDQKFIVHTQNRVHCTCSKDSAWQNVDCIKCRMCRHYLTCNCSQGDAELCKHTHAVRRYIVRNYTATDRTAESALENAVKRALSGFKEGCDTAEVNCDPESVTKENIIAVVENLKLALRSDTETESQIVEKLSISCDDSMKNKMDNLESVVEEVNQVLDSENVSNEKILSEVDSCSNLSGDHFKDNPQNFEPQLQLAMETIGSNDFVSSVIVENDESAAVTTKSSSLNIDSINFTSVQLIPDQSVGDDKSTEQEFVKSTVTDDSALPNESSGNCQLNPFLRNNDGIDTSKMGENELSVNINGHRCLENETNDAGNEFDLQSDSINEPGNCEKDQNEVSTPFDLSKVMTLKSFYGIQFEPVFKMHYKSNAETHEGESLKVLAESSKCIVTLCDSTGETFSWKRPVLLNDCFGDNETMVNDEKSDAEETCELGLINKYLELCHIDESYPNHKPVLPSDSLCGFGVEGRNENGVLSRTCGSSLVIKNAKPSKTVKNVLHWEPVFIEDNLFSSGAERKDKRKFPTTANAPRIVGKVKDLPKNSSPRSIPENYFTRNAPKAEPAPFDCENSFDGGFDAGNENENLVPKEKSKSTKFGAALKQKSLLILKRLNLAKYYKKTPKEDVTLSSFFGNYKNWSSSRRRRELAFLQSMSDDSAVPDVMDESFDLQ